MTSVTEFSELIRKLRLASQQYPDYFQLESGATEPEIAAAEKLLGHKIPDQYRWWLRNFRHGYVGEYCVLGLTHERDRYPDVVFARLQRSESNYLAPPFIEVVVDELEGDTFAIDLRPGSTGRIVLVGTSPEQLESTGHADFGALIAHAFGDGLSILQGRRPQLG